ncbi:hypothetical protein EK21DRAFT_84315 [Setomelanomma holmii]|uniref:Secreted protein n=1 Tax=Setomelanomma holmii TaxID=210430 RepID=A0A9P4LS17_9PLEO|nr:hypothetical protein EK21DRAFT_84315 [Setomelanomma holmii]
MVSLFLLLAIAGTSKAATCYEGQGRAPNVNQAWDLRAQVCGSNACANSDAAQGNNHYCNVYQYFNDGQSFVQLERNDPSGQYKSCWDAFENILNQCLDNGSGSGFNNEVPNGNWQVGDEWYWIHMNNTVAATPPLDLDNSADRYQFGPSKFCQGLSPGGSSCITIPSGCYIEIPLYNYVPEIHCDL